MTEVIVLRLGHRPGRDKRVTTHVGLVARAFGARGMIMTQDDKNVRESLDRVCKQWGGEFFVQTAHSWKETIAKWKADGGTVVHLTMYGLPLDEVMPKLPRKKLMVVVGAEKVPPEVFQLADYNVAIGNQPHSEVAALAIFLDRLFEGKELKKQFPGRKIEIVPSERGKQVIIKR